MVGWIAIGLVYMLAMGLFCWLGGISAAGDALSRWGCAAAARRRDAFSSSRC
jgi:hypothetical protein